MIQFQKPSQPMLACANCGAAHKQDDSHRFGVGLSHYRPTADGGYERSYVQVFASLHCCSHECAVSVAHDLVQTLHALPRGSYVPDVHNPNGEHAHESVKRNVEYNQDGVMAPGQLPKQCAICGAALVDKDIYIPHMDNSTLGTHYQDVLLSQEAYKGLTLADVTLGACSIEHGTQLAGAILDEILLPHHEGKPVHIGGAV